jgi:putative tributyrin esterase
MAFFKMRFQSHQLGQGVTVNVIMPDDVTRPVKTVWLYHGLSDDQNTWMEQTSIQRYAAQFGVAVVMPCSDRGWYTDTAYGKNYFTFVTKELVDTCRKYFPALSTRREDNMVVGNSMGGYGALKAALTCPETFGYCGALSASVDITRKGLDYHLDEWRSIFGFDMQSAQELQGSKHDLFALAEMLVKENKPMPKIYMWCGEGDRLLKGNQAFSKHLHILGIDHVFEETEGNHCWHDWDARVQDVLTFFAVSP